MLSHGLPRLRTVTLRPIQMASRGSTYRALNTEDGRHYPGDTLENIPKSNDFPVHLPPDPKFNTPLLSFNASREDLGPRMVKGALYTYIRPEETESPELLAISHSAMKDIGLKEGEEMTEGFKDMAAGNKIFWDKEKEMGIYPWAQCYGGR